jgi:deoxycytidine triphosphate deaminase
MTGIALPNFPVDDREAQARFDSTKSADPFPEIPPALLNTADMLDYVAATGMIYPFEIDPERPERTLKPASCAIPVGGEWLYWPPTSDSDGPEGSTGLLEYGQDLWLQPNSIVYVTLAPTFRMPDYIAARYNLRIRQIYRGILVGTGPLVDPGFQGRLSVPLHNLTSNPYPIKGGEPLVWMEFTKLTPHDRWASPPDVRPERKGEYVGFPVRKLERRSVRDYVSYAHDGPIRSSIPEETEHATIAAEKAEREVDRFRRFSVVAALAIAVAIAALTIQAIDFVNGAKSDERALRDDVRTLSQELSRQREALRLCTSGGSRPQAACIQRALR